MTEIKRFLSDIHSYCARTGLRPKTLSRRAVGDGKFVARLEAGGECLPSTMQRMRDYIAANPPEEDEAA